MYHNLIIVLKKGYFVVFPVEKDGSGDFMLISFYIPEYADVFGQFVDVEFFYLRAISHTIQAV